MTAEKFQELESKYLEEINNLRRKIEGIRNSVKIPPIEKLRPMTKEDIVIGQIVYRDRGAEYNGEDPWFWHIIEQVRDVDDEFKAYIADGCRFGLRNSKAYVRR